VAEEKNLFISGGSDFHSEERGSKIGDCGIGDKKFKVIKAGIVKK